MMYDQLECECGPQYMMFVRTQCPDWTGDGIITIIIIIIIIIRASKARCKKSNASSTAIISLLSGNCSPIQQL